jgi:WD40 repeat protein
MRTLAGNIWRGILVFSPNSRWLAAVGGDDYRNRVQIWDLATGQARTWPGQSRYNDVAFSPDSRRIAAGTDDAVKLWDVSTGRELPALTHSDFYGASRESRHPIRTTVAGAFDFAEEQPPKHHSFDTVAFAPDGRYLAAAEYRGPVRFWDVETGVEFAATLASECRDAYTLGFRPDGRRLTSACLPIEDAKVWDLPSDWPLTKDLKASGGVKARPFRTPPGDGQIGLYALRRDGVAAAASHKAHQGADGSAVDIWEVETGNRLGTLTSQEDCYSLALSPDGGFLACGGDHGPVLLWDLRTGREPTTLGGASQVSAVAFSPHGHVLASSAGRSVKLWDLKTGRERWTLAGHKYTVAALAFSPDGRWLASGSTDNVKLWDVATGRELYTLEGYVDSLTGLAFSPNGRWLALAHPPLSGNGDRSVRLWDVSTGRELHILADELSSRKTYASVAFSPQGRWLLADQTLWDLAKGRKVKTLTNTLKFGCENFAVHPSGRWLACSSLLDPILVWEVATSHEPRFLKGHDGPVHAVAFSPDGRWLASASGDRTIKLWKVSTWQPARTLSGHIEDVNAVAFSPDGRWLASAGHDGRLIIWDVRSGEEVISILPLGDAKNWLAATPDGLFDGTADAMRQVAWRIGDDIESVVPVASFFTDFFYPGLLADALTDRPPRAGVDIATVLQIPSLRTMLMAKQAHLEIRARKVVVCFHDIPGVAVQAPAGNGPDVPAEIGGFRIVPDDRSCKYQRDLPAGDDPSKLLAELQNWKPQGFRVRWEHQMADVTRSTLHVLTIGVGRYSASSGFAALPYAAKSARAIEDFFTQQRDSEKKAYAKIRVWPGLYYSDAMNDPRSTTRDAIRNKLEEMAKLVGEDDVVFLYLAGHGEVGQEMFYFVPSDGQEEVIEDTGLSTAMLAEALRNMPARLIVLIIDACQSGGAVEALGKIGEAKVRDEQHKTQAEGVGASRHERRVGVHILAATTPLAFAVQLPSGQSALMDTLLEVLNSNSGSVTANQVGRYMQRRLPEVSEKGCGFRQEPLIRSVGADFPLTTN